MNVKCDKCGHEGPKETFSYLYNIRLDDGMSWHECPKCHAMNWISESTGEHSDFGAHCKNFPFHSDKGIGIHSDKQGGA